MTADGAYAGLLLAVTIILTDGARRCAPAIVGWVRSGFVSSRSIQQRTAAAFVFAGILLFHFRQLFARSVAHPIDPDLALWIGFAANALMGYGGALYHAARIAAEGPHRVRKARWYMRGAIVVMAACAVGVPLVLPLHAPVPAARGAAK